jgi:hypothetical protein
MSRRSLLFFFCKKRNQNPEKISGGNPKFHFEAGDQMLKEAQEKRPGSEKIGLAHSGWVCTIFPCSERQGL